MGFGDFGSIFDIINFVFLFKNAKKKLALKKLLDFPQRLWNWVRVFAYWPVKSIRPEFRFFLCHYAAVLAYCPLNRRCQFPAAKKQKLC